jgi:hypothetical protein
MLILVGGTRGELANVYPSPFDAIPPPPKELKEAAEEGGLLAESTHSPAFVRPWAHTWVRLGS